MKDMNFTCHWCRISKNRKRVKQIQYIPCSSCRKVYCKVCIDQYPEINPTAKGCLYCRKLCCCCIKCEKDHKCCYNAKRSSKRCENKRKFDQIDTALIEVVEAEFDTMNIFIPIPIRVIPILKKPNYGIKKPKKNVTWNL